MDLLMKAQRKQFALKKLNLHLNDLDGKNVYLIKWFDGLNAERLF
jgi:hypothetical protein